jgi:polysaccharide deacetylase family protein (PEP-CTERM system associated)
MSRPLETECEPRDPADVVHLLSFDVEEYFQAEAAATAAPKDQWEAFPRRLEPVIDRLLEMLAAHRTVATFFVLGWVARHERPLVDRIGKAGHEIASHGVWHRMLGRLTPREFAQDLRDSRRALEDIAGRPVIGYRAPTFSLTHRTAWALDVLAQEGFEYDSSVFPVHHDRYGVPDAPRCVHRATGPDGNGLLEIPPLTLRFARANWPVGGGGYLRLLPIRVVASALRSSAKRGEPGMLYLHPWELDAGQPRLSMTCLSRFRHRVGLRRTAGKLEYLLARFRFACVRDRLNLLRTAAVISYAY